MSKLLIAFAGLLVMASHAQAAEFRIGSVTFDHDEQQEVAKRFLRPPTCLTAINLVNERSGSAVRITEVKASYQVDGLGVDREKIDFRGMLDRGESSGWLAVPQKPGRCVIAILVEGESTGFASRDSKVQIYGAK